MFEAYHAVFSTGVCASIRTPHRVRVRTRTSAAFPAATRLTGTVQTFDAITGLSLGRRQQVHDRTM